MILRSLEHLQRVALTEWTERNLEDRRSVRASEAASPMELRPDPSNEGIAERLHNLDLVADQLTSALAAELGDIGDAAPALDKPLLSAEVDLDTEIQKALGAQLNRREPDLPTFSSLPATIEAPQVDLSAEVDAEGLRDAAQGPAADLMPTGEAKPEVVAPLGETQAAQLTDKSGIPPRLHWVIVVIIVVAVLAALFYRTELAAIAAGLLDQIQTALSDLVFRRSAPTTNWLLGCTEPHDHDEEATIAPLVPDSTTEQVRTDRRKVRATQFSPE